MTDPLAQRIAARNAAAKRKAEAALIAIRKKGTPRKGDGEPLPDFGAVIGVEDFITYCVQGFFIDYDGHGQPAKDGRMYANVIHPSNFMQTIPFDADSVIWFNR